MTQDYAHNYLFRVSPEPRRGSAQTIRVSIEIAHLGLPLRGRRLCLSSSPPRLSSSPPRLPSSPPRLSSSPLHLSSSPLRLSSIPGLYKVASAIAHHRRIIRRSWAEQSYYSLLSAPSCINRSLPQVDSPQHCTFAESRPVALECVHSYTPPTV